MKIVYDSIIYSLQQSGGISLYWSQLEKYNKSDVRLLYKNYNSNIFYNDFPDRLSIKINKSIIFERCKNISMEYLPDNLKNHPVLFHSSYYRYCKDKNVVNITTVHDFIAEFFNNSIKGNFHKLQKRNAILHSKAIICNSENTKKDFCDFFPDYNGYIKVIYLGISDDYFNLNMQRKNTVLFIGGRSKYKNFIYAVKIIEKLKNLSLQIIGGGDLKNDEIDLLKKNLPNRFEYIRSLTNKELNVKYNESRFLLYPSLYEGFGIPVVEAQAAGCPVVCCNVSSLHEVSDGSVVYISGRNIDKDIHLISKLDNHNYYYHIVEKGLNNCKRFSWKRCADQTYEFYQEVYANMRI
jgi:mannosyltransferase